MIFFFGLTTKRLFDMLTCNRFFDVLTSKKCRIMKTRFGL